MKTIKNLQTILITASFAMIVFAGCTKRSSSSQNISVNPSVEESLSYPMTITHALGTITIPSKPKRIATISWGNQSVPLALGVVPVGVSMTNYGPADKNGLLPWVAKGFEDLGAASPVVFKDTDGLDYEAIADTNPDIILASYSGITQNEYDTLSKIAPVMAYTKGPYITSWREETIENARAMGMEEEGKELVKRTEKLIADKLDQYPQISGKTGAFFWFSVTDLSTYYIYLTKDPRGAYLEDLGLTTPESVRKLSADGDSFALTISAENSDMLNDVDVIICYGDDNTLAALQADRLIGKIPAIKNGAVVVLENDSALAASTTADVLSIPYTIDEYLTKIAAAASLVK